MSKKKDTNEIRGTEIGPVIVDDVAEYDINRFDFTAFSIVQLPVDQNTPIPSQRILQTVVRNGDVKQYVSESSYFRGEMYAFLAKFIELSFEASIQKKKTALTPVAGGRYWMHFNQDTWEGKPQKRVDPEKFE